MRFPHDPVAVNGSDFTQCHWHKLGRREEAVSLSQKTCLFDSATAARDSKGMGMSVSLAFYYAM